MAEEFDFKVGVVDAASGNLQGIENRLKSLETSAKNATSEIEKMHKALQGLEAAGGAGGSSGKSVSGSGVSNNLSARIDHDIAAREAAAKRESQAIRMSMQAREDASNEAARLAQQALKDEEAYQASLSNTRYALYDVASLYRNIGFVAAASAGAIIGTGAAFESSFVHVARTADLPVAKLQNLRQELKDLTTAIPESFDDMSRIATLGGQMDIAGDKLAGFASTVSMFSATTDVAVEKTAMSFGRTIQLTQESQDKFDNLAAAVYEVGVHTVATEDQILTMTEQLAASGNMAGFSAQEIVGLSGALASLGVQPERARGSMERAFNQITAAVDMGGEKLQQFAAVSGMSADEFAAKWKEAPKDAFVTLLQGMNEVQAAGGNFQMMLNDMGIAAVRDLDTFKRLASNVDLVKYAMATSNTAWDDGTAHLDAYGQVSDTVAAKAKILGNTVLAVLDSLSNNEGLKKLIDALQFVADQVLKVIDFFDRVEVAGISMGKTIGGIAVGALAAVAGYTMLSATLFTFRASLMAVETAQMNMSKTGDASTLRVRNMSLEIVKATQRLFGFRGATVAAAQGNQALSASAATATTAIKAQGVEADVTATKVTRMGSMMGKISAGARALAGPAMFLGGTAAISGGIWMIEQLSSVLKSAESRAKETAVAWSDFGEAIKADTQTFRETGDAVNTYTLGLNDNMYTQSDVVAVTQNMALALKETNGDLEAANELIRDNTMAWGENAQAQALQDIMADDTLKMELQAKEEILKQYGITTEEVYAAIIQGGTAVDELLSKVTGANDELSRSFIDANANASDFNHLFLNMSGDFDTLGDLIALVTDRSDDLSDRLNDAAWVAQHLGAVSEALGIDLENIANGAGSAADGIEDVEQSMYDALVGTAQFEQSMYDLGVAFAQNGESLSAYSESGRANIQALSTVVNAAANAAGNDTMALANFLGQILNTVGFANGSLVSGFTTMLKSIATSDEQFNSAIAVMNSYRGAAANTSFQAGQAAGQMRNLNKSMGRTPKAAKPAAKSLKDVGKGAKKAGDSAKKASREVRTLSDYVGDLRSVMSASFTFRWGLDQSSDGLKDAYADIVKSFEDAEDKVKDLTQSLAELRAEQQKLSAEKGTLEYQLTVAQDYGDDLRVAEIQAELAKNAEETSKNQSEQSKAAKELGEAQQAATRDLSGTTAASREQRAEVLNLVQAYQSQIEALANTGMSKAQLIKETAKLKGQFVAQMRQLGYSEAATQRYAKSLDDFALIVKRVPRNLTVKVDANTNPAVMALREYEAKKVRDKKNKVDLNTSAANKKIDDLNKKLANLGSPGGGGGGAGGGAVPEKEEPKKPLNIPKGMGHFPEEDTYRKQGEQSGRAFVAGLESQAKQMQAVVVEARIRSIANSMLNRHIVTPANKYLGGNPPNMTVRPVKSTNSQNRNLVVTPFNKWSSSNPASVSTKTTMPSLLNRRSTRSGTTGWYSSNPSLMATNAQKPASKTLTAARTAATKAFSLSPASMASRAQNASNLSDVRGAATGYFRDNPFSMRGFINTANRIKVQGGWQIGFSSGGFTGRGGKYDVAGEVHRGEYVFPKDQVDQRTGLPTLSALGAMMAGYPASSAKQGSSGSSGATRTMVVELSPTDRRLLAESGHAVVVLDGKQIASSVNNVNANSSLRGM